MSLDVRCYKHFKNTRRLFKKKKTVALINETRRLTVIFVSIVSLFLKFDDRPITPNNIINIFEFSKLALFQIQYKQTPGETRKHFSVLLIGHLVKIYSFESLANLRENGAPFVTTVFVYDTKH